MMALQFMEFCIVLCIGFVESQVYDLEHIVIGCHQKLCTFLTDSYVTVITHDAVTTDKEL